MRCSTNSSPAHACARHLRRTFTSPMKGVHRPIGALGSKCNAKMFPREHHTKKYCFFYELSASPRWHRYRHKGRGRCVMSRGIPSENAKVARSAQRMASREVALRSRKERLTRAASILAIAELEIAAAFCSERRLKFPPNGSAYRASASGARSRLRRRWGLNRSLQARNPLAGVHVGAPGSDGAEEKACLTRRSTSIRSASFC